MKKIKELAASLRSGTLLKFSGGLVWRVYDIRNEGGQYLVSVTDNATKTRYPDLNVARLAELFGQWGFPEIEAPKRVSRTKRQPAKPRIAKGKKNVPDVAPDAKMVDADASREAEEAVAAIDTESERRVIKTDDEALDELTKEVDAEAASETASVSAPENLKDFEIGMTSHEPEPMSTITSSFNMGPAPVEAVSDGAAASAEAVPTPSVEVAIQKGEGMIKALSRTIETQYGVDHDTAMEIANKTWAKNPSDWYNVVHEGDVFKVSVEGMDPADIPNADPAEVAKHLEFSSDQFTAKSGIDPRHEFASITPKVAEAPVAAAEKAFDATTGPAVADFESVLVAKGSGRIGMNPLAESFMAEHGIRINPDTFEFGVDVSGDGSISAQEVIVRPGSHLKDISRMDILFNPDNKTLVLETLSGDGVTKEVLTLDNQLNVVDGYTESMRMDDIIQLKGRALNKVMKAFGAYHEISDKLAANTAGLDRVLQTLKVEDVLGGKKEAIKALVEDGLSPRDAKRLLKPLWGGFNVLQKNGVHLSAGETISNIIERASQSPA